MDDYVLNGTNYNYNEYHEMLNLLNEGEDYDKKIFIEEGWDDKTVGTFFG